jgi:hypothetical protein
VLYISEKHSHQASRVVGRYPNWRSLISRMMASGILSVSAHSAGCFVHCINQCMRFTVLGGNAPLLKRQNRAAVLQAIVSYGPISRRALRDATGLTASTITNIVGELIANRMVREIGVSEPTVSPSQAGRREVMVDLPIVVDSGRRGMALAEMMFGLGQNVRDFAHVHVASTVVAGLVLDQRLHRGATGTAGSLGHTTVAGERTPCACGKIGCLDTIASEVAMERRAAELSATPA